MYYNTILVYMVMIISDPTLTIADVSHLSVAKHLYNAYDFQHKNHGK